VTRMAARSEPDTKAPRRRRLSVDARRDELLRVGMELFSTRAYDEIWVEEIAARAGVSRGLLYHYFPTKRDFYVAVTRTAARDGLKLSAPDPSLGPAEQLRAGVDAFVRYAEEHHHGFLTAWRGSLAGDPEVRAIGEEARQVHVARILNAVVPDADPPPLLRLAVHGWIVFAQDVIASWLADRAEPRDAVCDLLIGALTGVIAAAVQTTPTQSTAGPG
jgi:AcrR family transcriptional regulator